MTLLEGAHDALIVIGSALGGYAGQHLSARRIRAAVAAATADLRKSLADLLGRVRALEIAVYPEGQHHG